MWAGKVSRKDNFFFIGIIHIGDFGIARGQIKGGILDGPLAFDNAIGLEAAKIKDVMENAVDLKIPNKVDYESGPNWGSIK